MVQNNVQSVDALVFIEDWKFKVMFMCVIQVGVRTKLTYEIERLIATERIKESLNAKMSCPKTRPVRRH